MAKNVRERVLDAASRVARRSGTAALTLDAVVKEAEVSKGGLIYHFKDKDALVKALVEREAAQLHADVQRHLIYPDEPGAHIRALIGATFEAQERGADVILSLLTAITLNPELLSFARTHYAALQHQLEDDGLPEARATLLRLATDGLWLADLLGLAAPEGEAREHLKREMFALTTPSDRR